MANNEVQQLLADSRLAFLNQQTEMALKLANDAKKIEPNNPEGHKCAANAYMSMGKYEEAIKSYSIAAKYDPNNGNRYYDLGFACAGNSKYADAIKNLAKAEELGCTPENLVQLYNLLGVICYDIGRYDDALINLEKAEQVIGVDMEILQRKAVIYSIKQNYRKGLEIANQIKMIAPSEYIGYQIAFKLLVQAKRYEAAQEELKRSQKYVAPCIDFYFDCMSYELEKYELTKDRNYLKKALELLEQGLEGTKPTVKEVMDSYLGAAEIYLQMDKGDDTIKCLNSAQNAAYAYNNGFKIIEPSFAEVELTDYDVKDMIEEDRARIAEELGEYGLEELAQMHEPDENGSRDYFTEIDEEIPEETQEYKLNEDEAVELEQSTIEQINRLYVGAYTANKDYEKVIEYARRMQADESLHSIYVGKYAEVNAMKALGLSEANKKYEELVNFFRNAMIKDPSDILAVTMRVQCYIDMGNYAEAENLCNLLTKEVREKLLEKINEAKAGEV